jgi:hypothetical protein
MKYTPTHDKGKNLAHATQSDGFRPVSGPGAKAGSTSPRSGSGQSNDGKGPKKCYHCGKTVYFAEEQLYDSNIFHISCFPIWSKNRDQSDLAPRNASYERGADVQPAYYRTGETTGEARLETGSSYKSQGPNSSAPQGSTGPSKFCPNCGGKRNESAKFCAGCGSKLE